MRISDWSSDVCSSDLTGPDIQRREIAIAAGGIYHAAVSYVVDGVQGARLILGPVACGAATYPDGTPIEDLKPAEPGATDGATVGENVRDQIGRASCRGRVGQEVSIPVVAGSLKKK